VRKLLRLPLIPQRPDVPVTLGVALGTAIGAWIGAAVADDLRHGWRLGGLAVAMAAIVGGTLLSNYLHSRR